MNHITSHEIAFDYPTPVAGLLTLGKTDFKGPQNWLDYVALAGLGPEHIPDLIRMACDDALNHADVDTAEAFAPVHSWRALGQLRAEAAVAPLLAYHGSRVDDDDYDDAPMVDLPIVFGMIGPPAIEPVAAFLTDPARGSFFAATALQALSQIGNNWPDTRDECIAIMARLLAAPDVDPETAGYAVWRLIDLRAVEVIDVISDAFTRDAVEIPIAGDLEDVEIALGLRAKRKTPKPNYLGAMLGAPVIRGAASAPPKPKLSDDTFKVRPVQPRSTVGRNDPCPCGSGKKYKKCCLG
jgi:hypothetical protein